VSYSHCYNIKQLSHQITSNNIRSYDIPVVREVMACEALKRSEYGNSGQMKNVVPPVVSALAFDEGSLSISCFLMQVSQVMMLIKQNLGFGEI
jgi:hypothetical protein